MSSSEAGTPTTSRQRSWGGSRLGQLLALVGLTGLAISQPLLSVLGENPTLFVYNNVDGLGVVLLALGVAFVPPLLLWLVIVVVGLISRSAADVVFVVVATILAACAALQFMKWLGPDNAVVVSAFAFVVAAGFAVALVRFSAVGEWLRYLAVLPVLAVVVFLAASPTHNLLQRRDAIDPTASGDLPPVVFVMLDEFPTKTLLAADGSVDRVRFPNFASFADSSTWYRDYTVQSGWTEVSVPSILSGQDPIGGRAGLWTDYPDTIFSLLAPTHELTAFESFTSLCGFPSCGVEEETAGSNRAHTGALLADVAQIWRDRVTPGATSQIDIGDFGEAVVAEAPAAEGDDDAIERVLRALSARPERAQAFIDSIDSDDEVGLYYLHLLYPHQPWTVDPQGTQYVDNEPSAPAVALTDTPTPPASEWDIALQEQRHIWQAMYTDQVLGQVFARLRETGLYDKALVVVTADHGVAFDGGKSAGRRVSEDATSGLAYAPLFMKLPGQVDGHIDDSNLMSVDLLPTVARAAGVTIPWPVTGYPAGSPEIRERGSEKLMYDFFSPSSTDWDRVLRFDDTDKPTAAERAIGPTPEGSSPVAGLVATLGLADRLGMSIDAFAPSSVAPVDSPSLQELRKPVSGYSPVNALVEGELSDDAPGGRVLVALNGVIVTAAPVEDGKFRTIIPPADVRRNGNEVQLLLLVGDQVTELELA